VSQYTAKERDKKPGGCKVFIRKIQCFLVSVFRLVFLNVLLPPKHPRIIFCLFFLGLTAEFLMIFVLTYFPEPNDTTLFKLHIITFIFFYPLASYLTPILGLLAILIRKEPFFSINFYNNMNAASCIMNTFLSLFTLVLGNILLVKSDNFQTDFCILLALILLKITNARLAGSYQAYLENKKFYPNKQRLS
jgi:hypothetical protein